MSPIRFPISNSLPSKILVVVAHPDDEVLGCGATIARFAEEGCAVRVLLALQCSESNGRRTWLEMLESFRQSCELLGADAVVADPLVPERNAESELHLLHDAILPHIEWCDTVLSHWVGDTHQAHRSVARAVELGTRPFRRRRQVLAFEVGSSTDQSFGPHFAANAFVISEERHVELKNEALKLYCTEYVPGRTPRDVQRRMEFRGSEIGVEFAEAFVIGRMFF
ncbi:MAG: PIG-L family deacetylase [Candidatus Kapaibacterium sp.]|jgi:LmbE family N-acetylglucosaminyl deacetylase